eukprot:6003678-Pyramimonas_sp.AAC.1
MLFEKQQDDRCSARYVEHASSAQQRIESNANQCYAIRSAEQHKAVQRETPQRKEAPRGAKRRGKEEEAEEQEGEGDETSHAGAQASCPAPDTSPPLSPTGAQVPAGFAQPEVEQCSDPERARDA